MHMQKKRKYDYLSSELASYVVIITTARPAGWLFLLKRHLCIFILGIYFCLLQAGDRKKRKRREENKKKRKKERKRGGREKEREKGGGEERGREKEREKEGKKERRP